MPAIVGILPAPTRHPRLNFRIWAGRNPEIPADIADVAMDLTPHKSVVPVAWADDYFQERVPVMQMWAESKSGTAVSISATRVEAGRVAY